MPFSFYFETIRKDVNPSRTSPKRRAVRFKKGLLSFFLVFCSILKQSTSLSGISGAAGGPLNSNKPRPSQTTNSKKITDLIVKVNQDILDSETVFLGSIDQGTSSTRYLLFTKSGRIAASAQIEHCQLYPQSGWHEHDPRELWENTLACMIAVDEHVNNKGRTTNMKRVSAIGITNQRETTIAWNKVTGEPYHNAIVWDDTRTAAVVKHIAGSNSDLLRAKTGLPLATYFSGTKVKWLLDNVDDLRKDVANKPDEVCFGTVDTWLLYQLTGDKGDKDCNSGGLFLTDVSNASRWLFTNLKTCQWDKVLVDKIVAPHNLPLSCLPSIQPSSHVYGHVHKDCGLPESFHNVPLSGILGDQQAALVGQTAFEPGQAKNTYGTGMFLLMNTGTKAVPSMHGMLTTVAYQMGENEPVVYALEGSVAHVGSTIQWLRDQLGLIATASESEDIATSSNDGMYFVPAFSGWFAPYWKSEARACMVGMTTRHHKGHIVRAALEATAYQAKEVLDAIQKDSSVQLLSLKVDGGGTANGLLMQFQADMLNVPVIRPRVLETTALGAAYAAGLAVGVYANLEEIKALWGVDSTFQPSMSEQDRARNWKGWKKAVERSFGWSEEETVDDEKQKVEAPSRIGLY